MARSERGRGNLTNARPNFTLPLDIAAPPAHFGTMLDRPTKPPLTIRLCQPRGFCAGVDRAIQIVVLALKKYGAPVYVRHEIVHNRYVVEGLQKLGAVFIEELSEIPPEHQASPVVFSAHGVPKSVPADAAGAQPLLSRRDLPAGLQGAQAGDAPPAPRPPRAADRPCRPSGGDRHDGPAARRRRHADRERGGRRNVSSRPIRPHSASSPRPRCRSRTPPASSMRCSRSSRRCTAPAAESICYATTNRQEAVKETAAGADLFLVVGAPNSSNSRRLVEVAERAGAKMSLLVQRASEIPWDEHRQDRNARPLGRRVGAGNHRRRDHRRVPRALRRDGRSGGDGHGDGEFSGHARAARRRTHQRPTWPSSTAER